MKTSFSRRSFFQTLSLAASGAALGPSLGLAVEPFKRAGQPRLLLSLAAYSFRDFFTGSNQGKAGGGQSNRSLDLFQFVDFCADHGCDGTELTSYYFPKNLTDDFLIHLRRHAFLRGIAVSGTAVGNTFTLPPGPKRDAQIGMVKKWVDHAALLTAPHIRIFAGTVSKDLAKDEAIKLCVEAIEECADYAGQKGIFLGLENHGGIVSDPQDLLTIIRAVKSPWVGINLDTGNFHTEDPYRDLEQCAPYAVNVQVKAELSRRGQKAEPMDLARVAKLLRDVNYQGYVALEYESKEDPWKAVPDWLNRMKKAFAS